MNWREERFLARTTENPSEYLYHPNYLVREGLLDNPNTDNTKGGELDIFYETLDDEFFGGKSLEGVKITKLGKNAITAGLLGVSMSITKEN